MKTTKPRKITVQQDNPVWQEYDRDVLIELWHNKHQTTVLRLSRDEAWNLRYALARFLEPGPAPKNSDPS